MKRVVVAAFVAALVLTGLSVPVQSAEQAPAGQKTIYIVFDRGITADMVEAHTRERNQIGNYMDKDLVRVFARYSKQGFVAQLIEKAEDFKPAGGSYLLTVKITEYNGGSKAARMFVGYGAGGVNLKTRYELSQDGKTSLAADDASCFSGREWMNACRKVNEIIAKAVTEKIRTPQ